jgi:Arc/MetJ family transcription regulator
MSRRELEEIRTASDRERLTVSEWVRRALRDVRAREQGVGVTAVHEGRTVYAPDPFGRVRLEVEVKSDLLEAVRERYRLPNARAAVEFALTRAAVRPMTKEEALAMQGTGWEGDLDEMRSGDPGCAW